MQLLKADKEEIFSLSQQVMACLPPAHSYSFFLHEQYIFFCLESVHQELSHVIEDSIQLLHILRSHNILDQHLMCEVYMHDYVLGNDQSFNPVPYMGDIQLRAFTSYVVNQVKWKKAFNTYEENQENRPLVLQMEYC